MTIASLALLVVFVLLVAGNVWLWRARTRLAALVGAGSAIARPAAPQMPEPAGADGPADEAQWRVPPHAGYGETSGAPGAGYPPAAQDPHAYSPTASHGHTPYGRDDDDLPELMETADVAGAPVAAGPLAPEWEPPRMEAPPSLGVAPAPEPAGEDLTPPDAIVAIAAACIAVRGSLGELALATPQADEAAAHIARVRASCAGPVAVLAPYGADPQLARVLDAVDAMEQATPGRAASAARSRVQDATEALAASPHLLEGASAAAGAQAWTDVLGAMCDAFDAGAGSYLSLADGLSRLLAAPAGPSEAQYIATMRERSRAASVAPLELHTGAERLGQLIGPPHGADPAPLVAALTELADALDQLARIERREDIGQMRLPHPDLVQQRASDPAIAAFRIPQAAPAAAPSAPEPPRAPWGTPAPVPPPSHPSAAPVAPAPEWDDDDGPPSLEVAPSPPALPAATPPPPSGVPGAPSAAWPGGDPRHVLAGAIVEGIRTWATVMPVVEHLAGRAHLQPNHPDAQELRAQIAPAHAMLEMVAAELPQRAPDLVEQLRHSDEPRTAFAELLGGYRQLVGASGGAELGAAAAALGAVRERAYDERGPLRQFVDAHR